MSLFVRRPPSAHPSAHKKLSLTLPLSAVRPGANPINCFALKCKHLYRIDPTYFIGLAPGRRAEVGQVQYQEKYWVEGGGRTADNEGQWQTADGGRREVFTPF